MTSTNAEKLDRLFDELYSLKTDMALVKSSQIDVMKILKGNGKSGLVDDYECTKKRLDDLDKTVKALLEELKCQRDKIVETKERWYWLLIERIAVPIVIAAITAKVLEPLLK